MGDQLNRPWWVRLTLFGVRTRTAAVRYMRASLLFFPAGIAIGTWLLFESRAFRLAGVLWFAGGVLALPTAWVYYAAIRWMDKNRRWPEPGR